MCEKFKWIVLLNVILICTVLSCKFQLRKSNFFIDCYPYLICEFCIYVHTCHPCLPCDTSSSTNFHITSNDIFQIDSYVVYPDTIYISEENKSFSQQIYLTLTKEKVKSLNFLIHTYFYIGF